MGPNEMDNSSFLVILSTLTVAYAFFVYNLRVFKSSTVTGVLVVMDILAANFAYRVCLKQDLEVDPLVFVTWALSGFLIQDIWQ